MDLSRFYLAIVLNIIFSLKGISADTFYDNGSLCDYKYDNTPMPGRNSSSMFLTTNIKLSLITQNYPNWSTSNGGCSCTMTSRGDNTLVTFNVSFFQKQEAEDQNHCSAMVHKSQMLTFYSCPQNPENYGLVSGFSLKSGASTTLELYNPQKSEVKAEVEISSNRPDIIITCATKEDVQIPHDFCPCNGNRPTVGIVTPQIVPTSKRLLIGFMAALAFLICCGVILLLACLIKRGYIKGFNPCNYRKEEKEKKENIEANYENVRFPYASNLAYESDTPPPLSCRTPQSKSIDGIYATVDLSGASHKLPFCPDANLRLDIQTPDDSEVCSKYRGSKDSGLYSEISNEKLNNIVMNNNRVSQNNSFTGPYATSRETLQSLGPDFKFEPPAGQSSPKLPPKTKEEIDALYAKPVKKRKRKKSQSKENLNNNEETHKNSQQKLNTSSQISIEDLPEYHPRPMGSRSGSSNIISQSMVSPSPSGGSANILYLNQNSRSDNELYMTDNGQDFKGSRGTISTDV